MQDSRKNDPSRRTFCAAAGAGLVIAAIPACVPDETPRVGEGSLDNGNGGTGGSSGGGTGGTGGGGGSGGHGGTGGGGGGGGGTGGTGGSGGGGGTGGTGGSGGGGGTTSHDMAGQAPNDMAMAPACKPLSVSAGVANSYTVGGTPKYFSGNNDFFVLRDAGGLMAVSASCTHQGCSCEVQGNQLYCPCHGATFAWDGSKPTSPAFSALPHYAMCVDGNGNVTVDPTTKVSSSTRY